MNKIDEIAQIMNSGIHTKSTLCLVVPMITQLCLEKHPERVEEIKTWFIPEAGLSRPHPGLDERYTICTEAINSTKNIDIEATMKK